jgi:hypothetical protein
MIGVYSIPLLPERKAMTIDEALRRSATMQNCWLVWRTDTGELISLEDADTCGKTLDKSPFPTKARWLPTSDVTRDLLEDEADACHQTNRRGAILNQWARSPVEVLVQIMEHAEYEQPYVGPDDAKIVMEYIFHLHADELILSRRDLFDRLVAFAGTGRLNPRLNTKLRRQLAVADLDADGLKKIWSATTSQGGLEAFFAAEPFRDIWFIEEFGDVHCRDADVIDWLIATVAQAGMFTPRFMALVALGKIGPPAGNRAVEVIRASIYDGSPAISSMRELVIKRILTPPNDWTACTQCHRGRVLPAGKQFAEGCPACRSMGVIHIRE